MTSETTPSVNLTPPDLDELKVINPSTNLYILGLDSSSDNAFLEKLCSPYGTILSVKAIKDLDTNNCRGFGFVMFSKSEEASIALAALTEKGYPVTFAKLSFTQLLRALSDPTSTNLYFQNLPPSLSEDDFVKFYLEKFGKVESRRILFHSTNSTGVGFARMDNRENGENVINALHKTTQPGSDLPLQVRFADSKAQQIMKKYYEATKDYDVEHQFLDYMATTLSDVLKTNAVYHSKVRQILVSSYLWIQAHCYNKTLPRPFINYRGKSTAYPNDPYKPSISTHPKIAHTISRQQASPHRSFDASRSSFNSASSPGTVMSPLRHVPPSPPFYPMSQMTFVGNPSVMYSNTTPINTAAQAYPTPPIPAAVAHFAPQHIFQLDEDTPASPDAESISHPSTASSTSTMKSPSTPNVISQQAPGPVYQMLMPSSSHHPAHNRVQPMRGNMYMQPMHGNMYMQPMQQIQPMNPSINYSTPPIYQSYPHSPSQPPTVIYSVPPQQPYMFSPGSQPAYYKSYQG